MPLALMNILVNLAAQEYNTIKLTVLFSKSALVIRSQCCHQFKFVKYFP